MPPIIINDQFTNAVDSDGKPISKARRYQLRQEARGNCIICGAKRDGHSSLCPTHAASYNERQRRNHAKLLRRLKRLRKKEGTQCK